MSDSKTTCPSDDVLLFDAVAVHQAKHPLVWLLRQACYVSQVTRRQFFDGCQRYGLAHGDAPSDINLIHNSLYNRLQDANTVTFKLLTVVLGDVLQFEPVLTGMTIIHPTTGIETTLVIPPDLDKGALL